MGTSDNEPSSTRHVTSHDEHGMTLIVGDLSSYKCSGCKESGIGERYKCNEECPYILHPECRYHEEEATHEFLNGSTFKFFEELSSEQHRSSCIACGSDIKGYFYHCEATNKNLHPCCLNLEKTIQVGKMKFLLCKKLTSTCFYCHPNKKENMDKGWCYSLESGQDLQAHVSCMNDAIIECLTSESKEERGDTENSIKMKISVILKWAKKLFWEVIEFLKSSNTHVDNTTQFLKSAKIQLEKIITVLELLEKPLKKTAQVLGSACMHLGKVNAVLGGVIIILENLLIVISGFGASPQAI
ncbi:hypothetical protein L1987_75832 [Smallanthus sonchifolius]|uniref:Uncharacterized protein n=1 Tax=Smallanthus sonchifolius TaxID=185202 RepID=A0ACB9A724_9ASTR|nr:hypothetical protein L1987_75832 [Smallanthus sonchifolius]